MHDDLMQQEIAFQAFAKTIVDVLLEAKLLSAESLASRLEAQIASLHDAACPEAAHHLKRILEFAFERESLIQLRDLEAPSAH